MEPVQTTLVSGRFGEISFAEDDVIEFPWGLPGFAELRRFLALTLAEQPNFVWLQSLDDPSISLPACDPWLVFADYDPRLPAYAVETLGITGPEDFTILCIVVVTKNAEEMTMNLMAPVVINLRNRRGRQVTLEGSGYTVRTPVPRKTAPEATQPA